MLCLSRVPSYGNHGGHPALGGLTVSCVPQALAEEWSRRRVCCFLASPLRSSLLSLPLPDEQRSHAPVSPTPPPFSVKISDLYLQAAGDPSQPEGPPGHPTPLSICTPGLKASTAQPCRHFLPQAGRCSFHVMIKTALAFVWSSLSPSDLKRYASRSQVNEQQQNKTQLVA